MIKAKHLGHEIYYDGYNWKYIDSNKKLDKRKKCKKCGHLSTVQGYDHCLGELPGVSNACCGHGGEGYIQFNNGYVVRGEFKIIKKRMLGKFIRQDKKLKPEYKIMDELKKLDQDTYTLDDIEDVLVRVLR